MKTYIARFLFTQKELLTYLSIAFPMVVSQATDTFMFFTDRLFLTHYKEGEGEYYLNSTLTGGVTFFFLCGLFILTANFTNTITAQYFGSKQYYKCARVGIQSVYFTLFTYPIVLVTVLLVPSLYGMFNHHPIQNELQIIYTQVLLLGGIFAILRSGISGFFIGIGDTSIVMFSNIVGLLVNIPLNYMLINGLWFFPEMGIVGAGVATIASSLISLCIQLFKYFGKKMHDMYHTRTLLAFDKEIIKKLIRFGFPIGIRAIVGVGGFNYFILVMNSYGTVIGAAVTIAINWDSMFFIPMIGAEAATTSLVGRYMGARDIVAVKRAVRTSFAVVVFYALFVMFFLLTRTHDFVSPFMATISDPESIYPLAITMVRTACIYLIADAANITFTGALQGSGDTKVSMCIFISITIVFIILIYIFVQSTIISPIGAWFIFIGFSLALGIGMLARYLQGKWQSIEVINEGL